MSPGENQHVKGKEGVAKAKAYLDGSTAAEVLWTVYDWPDKLSLTWANGEGGDSFDMGGVFRVTPDLVPAVFTEGQQFAAEVKNVSGEANQGALYKEYLARCYRAVDLDRARFDHFLWITWHPFQLTNWTKLCGDAEHVRQSLAAHKTKLVAPDHELDPEICQLVADRTWVLVLCEKQLSLVPTKAAQGVVAQQRVGR